MLRSVNNLTKKKRTCEKALIIQKTSYINHFSEEWQDEYEEYCREYSLSIGNESAEQFVNYKSEQLEKAMEEGNA